MSTQAYRYAQAMAVTERARGRAEEERTWLDLLALLDTPAPAPSVVPEAAVEAFKAAWHKADDEGRGGERVRDGLTAALPFLTAAPSATRDEVADVLWLSRATDHAAPTAPEISDLCDEAADALLARFNITPKEDR